MALDLSRCWCEITCYQQSLMYSPDLPKFEYPPPPFGFDELALPGPFCPTPIKIDRLDAHTAVLSQLLDQVETSRKTYEQVIVEIARRAKVLQDLLNVNKAFREPIRMLLPEILSEIFLTYSRSEWLRDYSIARQVVGDVLHTNSASLQLLRVCRLWRTVAIDTPALWKFVDLVDWGKDAPKAFLDFSTYMGLCRRSPRSMRVCPGHFLGQPQDVEEGVVSSVMAQQRIFSNLTQLRLELSPSFMIFDALRASPMIVLPVLTDMQLSGTLSRRQYQEIGLTPKLDTPALKQFIVSDGPLMQFARLSGGLKTLSVDYRTEILSTPAFVTLLNKSLPTKLVIHLIGDKHDNWSPNIKSPLRLPTTTTLILAVAEETRQDSWSEWVQQFFFGTFPVLSNVTISSRVGLPKIIPSGVIFSNVWRLVLDRSETTAGVGALLQRAFPSVKYFKWEMPPSRSRKSTYQESSLCCFFYELSVLPLSSDSSNHSTSTIEADAEAALIFPLLQHISITKNQWSDCELSSFVDMVSSRVILMAQPVTTMVQLKSVDFWTPSEDLARCEPFLAKLETLFGGRSRTFWKDWLNDRYGESL